MKALILAGGKGTRLRPLTFSIAKQLVPVANRPVIEYGICAILEAGIKDFGIIVLEPNSEIEKALGDGSRFGAKFTYIPQPDPLGLAHAVKTAHPYLGDDEFIMYLGDNLIKSSIADLVGEFKQHKPAATILLTPVPNPQDFGVAQMKDGQVLHLDEKPKEPKSNLALVGVYLFDKRIHDMIAVLKPSKRGEFEITDAIQSLIDNGLTVRSHIVTGWWKDTGTVEAMLDANRLILEDVEAKNEAVVEGKSRIEGRVCIGKGTRIVNSTVRGPAIIGENCLIEDAFVGPFTAIDSRTKLCRSEIEHSIVLSDCSLCDVGDRIEGSLVGRGVTVQSSDTRPRSVRLVLGDNSSVVLT